ncbi:hypothetical protein PRIPAC_94675 [Pristionchus pacificus]|uniref:Uncharacterized protein n=1 Tax=Pristionchus pacificus TaxID=54126 RepID=A0A2A6CIS5_PRIPA|nr:hypothetical protein PRIPAC_94675 [Pristionchus pacificus]|eukprot:PDM77953.1 hypothetical protein PRIPAC_34820 [Pristionchus pacificus]
MVSTLQMENLQATSLTSLSTVVEAPRSEMKRPEVMKDLCAQLFRSCYVHVEMRHLTLKDHLTSSVSDISRHNAIENVVTLEETDLD